MSLNTMTKAATLVLVLLLIIAAAGLSKRGDHYAYDYALIESGGKESAKYQPLEKLRISVG